MSKWNTDPVGKLADHAVPSPVLVLLAVQTVLDHLYLIVDLEVLLADLLGQVGAVSLVAGVALETGLFAHHQVRRRLFTASDTARCHQSDCTYF